MSYITGELIKEIREKHKLTQRELAEKINVSDKTISKWETGKGLPDIGIIDDLAAALEISITDLFTGEYCENNNINANMKKSLFYVCPVCGNIITSVGPGSFSCCGIKLCPNEPVEDNDSTHEIHIEIVENEYHVFMKHDMNKKHYISFISYVTSEAVEIRRLYPEQDISLRFARKGHGFIYAYCNRHGLIRTSV